MSAPAIDKPGVYDVPTALYHQDPVAPGPSLSSSICKAIIEKSPRHAWLQHPRLNPAHEPIHKQKFDLGSAAHAMLLEGGAGIAVIDAPDYRTDAAKTARDDARNQGRIPVLRHQLADVEAMARAARAQLARSEVAGAAFVSGEPEQMLVWQENGAWCRCLLDWLPAAGNVFCDYKTAGQSANPEHWGQRALYDTGCDVQAAFYLRGIRAVLGIEGAHFVFIVQENEEPYALSLVSLSPAALAIADRKVDDALAWWRWCLERDRWPGYPGRVAYVEPPPWQEKRWLDREMRTAIASEVGEDLRRLAIDWQAPTTEAAE